MRRARIGHSSTCAYLNQHIILARFMQLLHSRDESYYSIDAGENKLTGSLGLGHGHSSAGKASLVLPCSRILSCICMRPRLISVPMNETDRAFLLSRTSKKGSSTRSCHFKFGCGPTLSAGRVSCGLDFGSQGWLSNCCMDRGHGKHAD